jgi:uncharacterized peroxidase-related enzyme
MFLKEIQNRPPEGMMRIAFKKLKDAGRGVPEIMHLFRFKKGNTDHLIRFTEEVMRGPSPLSRGIRELIGAFVSSRNQCCFCRYAHAPVAAQLLGKELVNEVLSDPENSRLDSAHKELFRYVGKLAENPALVTAGDISRLREAGWSEEAIYDALTVASLFKFYNTWNNGSGVRKMSSADYAHSGNRLITLGYCMDFSFIRIMKVVWVGRKEITYSDLKELMRIWLGSKTQHAPASSQKMASNGHECHQSGPGQYCAVEGQQQTVRPLPAGDSNKVHVATPS